MKNLIYQCWDGELPLAARVSRKWMSEYAERIGADYLFESNPRFVTDMGPKSHFYNTFKPIYTPSFWEWDNVMYVDMDIYPVNKCDENIFAEFSGDVGVVEEKHQIPYRKTTTLEINAKNDQRWARAVKHLFGKDVPTTPEGDVRVFNAGLVLFSKEGMEKARDRLHDWKEYRRVILEAGLPDFYSHDQNYLNAMLVVCDFDWVALDNKWNSFLHYLGKAGEKNRPVNDLRTGDSCFVHVQLRGADDYPEEVIDRIVHLPVNEWKLP